jgi:hypothetical protein
MQRKYIVELILLCIVLSAAGFLWKLFEPVLFYDEVAPSARLLRRLVSTLRPSGFACQQVSISAFGFAEGGSLVIDRAMRDRSIAVRVALVRRKAEASSPRSLEPRPLNANDGRPTRQKAEMLTSGSRRLERADRLK